MLSATSAFADDAPAATKGGAAVGTSGEWGGLYTGRTLGSGGGGVFATGGYPGFSAGVLFGVHDKIDIGVSAAPVYNAFLETRNFTTNFGLDLRAKVRFQIIATDTVSFLARVEPGVRFNTFSPVVSWGIDTTVGFDVGIKVMTGGTLYLGLEMPLFFGVDITNLVQIPILPGAGFEYHLNDFIGLGGRFMAGPVISIIGGGGASVTDTEFGMIGEAFFIFRWDRVK
jgi:hypothetical protein